MKPSYLLALPTSWARHGFAFTDSGEPCGIWSPLAKRWDLDAAISRYTGLPVSQAQSRVRGTEVFAIWNEDNAKSGCPCSTTLGDFNDTTSHDWLLLALKQANL